MRVFAAVLILAGCATAPVPQPEPAATPGKSGPLIAVRGSSCESAVAIDAKNEDEGIRLEHQWVRDNYPGSQWLKQDLAKCDGRPVDIVQIETPNGRTATIYFDISKWLGKH